MYNTLALIVGLFTIFYLYVKKKFYYFSNQGIPHLSGTFPFGSDVTWKMFSGKVSFVAVAEEVYKIFKGKFYRSTEYAIIFNIFLQSKRTLKLLDTMEFLDPLIMSFVTMKWPSES